MRNKALEELAIPFLVFLNRFEMLEFAWIHNTSGFGS